MRWCPASEFLNRNKPNKPKKGQMPKKKRSPKSKPLELALTGVGVEPTTDKKLIELGDAFIDEKEAKADADKRLKELDAEILNRMNIIGLKCYRIGDKFWSVKETKHVKVTTVKEKSTTPTAAPSEKE